MGEEGDILGATPNVQAVSGNGGLHEENAPDTGVDSQSPNVWVFPPSFEALLTLSTAGGTVGCTLEGEVALKPAEDDESERQVLAHDSNDAVVNAPEANASPAASANESGTSWQGRYCVYKIPIEEPSEILPAGDIDLEDDDAQARLEDLLTRVYGLTMEDVLEGFSPETDLGSGDAVVRSFTDSICRLRLGSQSSKVDGAEGNDGSTDSSGAVYKAVDSALRGDEGSSPKWREVQVRVGGTRVLEVKIVATSAGDKGEGDHERTSNGSDSKDSEAGPEDDHMSRARPAAPLSGVAHTFVVDCSGISLPPMLRPHLEKEGAHPSAIGALDRTRFFAAGPAIIDLAGVLAALAQEAVEKNALRNKSTTSLGPPSSPAIGREREQEGWPGIDLGRSRSRVLRVLPGAQGGGSRTAQECVVAVSGTPKEVILDVSPVMATSDGSAAAEGGASIRLSRLRPLSTSMFSSPLSRSQPAPLRKSTDAEEMDKGQNGETADNPSDTDSGKNSLRAQKPEDSPSKELSIGDRVEARFGGKSEWFPGVIREIHSTVDGDRSVTCGRGRGGGASGRRWPRSTLPYLTVDYDDGDVEERVPRVRVRRPGQKQPRFLHAGDEVDVKRGKRIFLARVVARAAPPPRNKKDGHYDLELLHDGRPGREGDCGGLVENCPRSATMALHGWPPPRT